MSNAWSSALLQALAADQRSIEFALRTVNGSALGRPLQIATRGEAGWSAGLGAGLRVQAGASVQPRTWQTAAGQIQIPISGESAARLTASRVAPGALVEVLARVPGSSEWDRIAAGVVRQLGRASEAPGYLLVLDDLIAGLRSRITTDTTADELFQAARADGTYVTSLTASYTPGNSTLTVTSTARLEREAGGIGVVEVTPTGGGTPFYLDWDDRVSGTVLGGVSPGGQFGTSAVSAGIGSTVRCIPFLAGHPMSILLKILLSTGTSDDATGAAGTNGAYDVYPTTWGYALPRDLVATSDIEEVRDAVMQISGVDYDWQALVTDSQPAGLGWIGAWLARAGVFLAMRQGCLTARVVQDITQTNLYLADLLLSDEDAKNVSWSLWDPSLAGEAITFAVDTAEGSNATLAQPISSLPVLSTPRADCTDAIRGADWAALSDEIIERRYPWETNLPGHISGTWPIHYARLCLGDVTRFSSPRLRLFGAEEAASGSRFEGRAVVIKRHVPDWFAGTVAMELAFLSPDPAT